MNWTITITPTSSALNVWTWSAVRADGENVIVSDQVYRTVEAAREAAQAAAQAYEDDVLVIQDGTITEQFTPVGVDPVVEEPVVEEPAPEVASR